MENNDKTSRQTGSHNTPPKAIQTKKQYTRHLQIQKTEEARIIHFISFTHGSTVFRIINVTTKTKMKTVTVTQLEADRLQQQDKKY